MPSPEARALTADHRRQLGVIAEAVARQVGEVAAQADVDDIDRWWLTAAQTLEQIVIPGWRAAAAAAVRYLRRHAAVEGVAVDPSPAPVNLEQLATALTVCGPVAFKAKIAATGSDEAALRAMTARLAGAAQRLTLTGDRETITQAVGDSDEIVGWRRVISARACPFCAMLASRGAVYAARTVAFRAHDSCHCSAEPLYEHEDEPPWVEALQDLWDRATSDGRRGPVAIDEFRRLWDAEGGAAALPASEGDTDAPAADEAGTAGEAPAPAPPAVEAPADADPQPNDNGTFPVDERAEAIRREAARLLDENQGTVAAEANASYRYRPADPPGGFPYLGLNGFLRSGGQLTDFLEAYDVDVDRAALGVRTMDESFDVLGVTTTETIHVRRWVELNHPLTDAEPGTEFVEDGYFSVTTGSVEAEGFGEVRMEVTVPPGMRCQAGEESQLELIFARGARMRVTGNREDTRGGGRRVLTMELIP